MPISISLKVGQRVAFPDGIYEFQKEKRNNILLFTHEDTGREWSLPEYRFVEMHSNGEATLVTVVDFDDNRRFDNEEFGPGEMWERELDPNDAKLTKEGRRALALQFFTRKWDEDPDTGLGDVGLQKLIDAWRPVVAQLGFETPNGKDGERVRPARLRNAIKNFGVLGDRPLRAFRSLRGKTRRLRFGGIIDDLMNDAVAYYWSDAGYDYNSAHGKFLEDVRLLNEKRIRKGDAALDFPKRPEVLRLRIRKSQCFENWSQKYGKDAAWRKFKGNRAHISADWPLEVVIMDHTVFDTWIVFDSKACLPLGRPGLSIAIDLATRMVVGHLLSFEPPSVYTIQTLLKRVNKPKTYIKKLYNIDRDWDGWGKPSEVLLDRAWENVSASFRHSLRELGIDLHSAPARTPQYKAVGERFFSTMNTMVAKKLKGGVRYNPTIMRSLGLDPSSEAVVLLDDLEEFIHEAIVFYNHNKNTGLDAVPARVWADKIAIRKRHMISDVKALDLLVGRIETGTLTTAGLKFRHMTFHDEDTTTALLQDLVGNEPVRTSSKKINVSARVKVTFKWNPADAGSIAIWNDRADKKGYVVLPNADPKFFDGLSFWHWEQIRAFAEARDENFISSADRWRARNKLEQKWAKYTGKLPLRETRNQRRGLAASQGNLEDRIRDETLGINADTPIEETTEAAANPQQHGVPDEVHSAVVEGANPKTKGRSLSQAKIDKGKRTKRANQREKEKEDSEQRGRAKLKTEKRKASVPSTIAYLPEVDASEAPLAGTAQQFKDVPKGAEWGDA